MTAYVEFRVYGLPAPQGSKNPRAIYTGTGPARTFTGKIAVHESSKKVKPWRNTVAIGAEMAIAGIPNFEQMLGPVAVYIDFVMPRLKSHYGTGRNAGVLKPGAPVFHTVYPDTDKCVRSTFDALKTAGVFKDDSQAAVLHARKIYGDQPGAHIRLSHLPETP